MTILSSFPDGFRKIPSSLGVATKIDKSSEDVSAKAQNLTLWDGSGEFNFRESFSTSNDDFEWPTGDLKSGEPFTLEDMFQMLREHGASSVQSSHVSVLSGDKLSCHWFTATSNTKESVFKPFVFTENVRISPLTVFAEDKDPVLGQGGRPAQVAGTDVRGRGEGGVGQWTRSHGTGGSDEGLRGGGSEVLSLGMDGQRRLCVYIYRSLPASKVTSNSTSTIFNMYLK